MFHLNYLDDVSKCIGNQQVFLFREVSSLGGSDEVCIANSMDLEYLKPDIGYGAKLQKYFVRRYDGQLITSFGLYEFPSCCAFCVSTMAYVEPEFRGKGINKIANKLRQAIAKHFEYSALLCTDVSDNAPERATLIGNGFEDIYTIKNKHTGNTVLISVKNLLYD